MNWVPEYMSIHELELSEDEMAILGERIKFARKNSHYTQSKAAELLECSIGHLSAIENGKTMPNGEELVGFCRLYMKDMCYFFQEIIVSSEDTENKKTASWIRQYGYLSDDTLKWSRRILSAILHELEEEAMQREGKLL